MPGPSSLVALAERPLEQHEPPIHIRAQVEPHDAAAAAIERAQIAVRLRACERTEPIGGARNRDLFAGRGGNLEEQRLVGAAFVQLPRRVEVARAIAERARSSPAFGEAGADSDERGGSLGRRMEV